MNIQKIQICLLAIIAVALVYIAVIYTNSNRYIPFSEYGTIDTRTGNVYLLNLSGNKYGDIQYLHKHGYSPYSQEEIDFAKKNMGKKGTDLQDYLVQDDPSTKKDD